LLKIEIRDRARLLGSVQKVIKSHTDIISL
jgi:hypothetical protein